MIYLSHLMMKLVLQYPAWLTAVDVFFSLVIVTLLGLLFFGSGIRRIG